MGEYVENAGVIIAIEHERDISRLRECTGNGIAGAC